MLRFFIIFGCLASMTATAQKSKDMQLLSNWDNNTYLASSGVVFNDCWGYVDPMGGEYAIVGSTSFVHFFNITDPKNPTLVYIDTPTSATFTSIWRDFKTYSHYAYAVADQGSEGLRIYDLATLPTSVTELAPLPVAGNFGRAHNIFVDTTNARLYVAGSNTRADGLLVYSLANPAVPVLLSSKSLPGGYCHDVYVRNNVAYTSQGTSGGFRAFNFADANNPKQLGGITIYNQQGYQHSSWLTPNGQYAVLADETHGKKMKTERLTWLSADSVEIVDADTFVSARNAPYTGTIPHNPFIKGNKCFISYYHEGIVVFDVTNPQNIGAAIAWYDTDTTHVGYSGYKGAWGCYPFLPSGTIIGSDVTYGMFLLRLCDPSACTTANTLTSLNIGATTAKVQWNSVPCADKSKLYVRPINGSWTSSLLNMNYKNLTGLQPSTTYQWRVKTRCGGTYWSSFTPIKTFTTTSNNLDAASDEIATFGIAPNPGRGVYTLTLPSTDVPYRIEVRDLSGRILRTETTPASSTYSLDLTGFVSGVYLISLLDGTNQPKVVKLIQE